MRAWGCLKSASDCVLDGLCFLIGGGGALCSRTGAKKELGARDFGRVASCPGLPALGPTIPRGAHQAPRGAGCELTCLPRGEKRRAPPGIGQVGRLGRCAGAGGSKLERFLVTDPLPRPPGDPSSCPAKPSYLLEAWLFHSSLALCGHPRLPGIPFPWAS